MTTFYAIQISHTVIVDVDMANTHNNRDGLYFTGSRRAAEDKPGSVLAVNRRKSADDRCSFILNTHYSSRLLRITPRFVLSKLSLETLKHESVIEPFPYEAHAVMCSCITPGI